MKIFIVNNFSPKEIIGGSEIQCWLLAKYLAKKGHKTTYVALQGLKNKRIEKGEEFDVHYLINKGDSKLKIFENFYNLLEKEKPDVCYIRIFRYLFLLNRVCEKLKIPVVFNTSHINDCKPDLEKIKFSLNPLKFLKLIRIVKQRHLNFSVLKKIKVITINKYHARLLKKKYSIKATPIYNSMEDNYNKNQIKKKKQVIWVNNVKERKRPELFIDLVNEFKNINYRFLMIGELQNNIEYYNKMIKKCEQENDNFKYLGVKIPEKVDKILAGSEIFINTCKPEGFGNNFIQAWFNKCPTITLSFDPDDIIEKNKIGFHSKTFKKMVEDLRFLMNNSELREGMGEQARKYALENHDIFNNVKKYEKEFKQLINEKKN